MPPVVEARGVTKRFPGVVANRNVSITLERGEVHALLGENGAGKSTLMNILYGLYDADEGEILMNGERVHFISPHEAIHHGIGMVHQHFMLVPVMTVTENMMLGEEATIGSGAVSAAVAAIIGAGIGWLMGGPVIAALWVIAVAIYFALALGSGLLAWGASLLGRFPAWELGL